MGAGADKMTQAKDEVSGRKSTSNIWKEGGEAFWESAKGGFGAKEAFEGYMSMPGVSSGRSAVDTGAFKQQDQYTSQFDQAALEAQQRQAAQMDQGQSAEMRAGQQDLINMLGARARGEGPSIAEMQLRQGTDRTIAGAQALAASQAGVNPALALRGTQAAATQANLQTSQQQALLRAQEMEAARGQLGQQLGAVRGQDIGVAQQNLAAQMQQQQMNDAYASQLMEQGFSRDEANRQASMAAEAARQQQEESAMSQQLEAERIRGEKYQAAGGGFVSALGALAAAASDVTAKKNIKMGDKELDAFMNSLAGYEYEYTDEAKEKIPEGTGNGKILSVMAQDLERTPMGKEMVVENMADSGKKGVNYGKGLGTMLASIARLNERLNDVEGK